MKLSILPTEDKIQRWDRGFLNPTRLLCFSIQDNRLSGFSVGEIDTVNQTDS